MPAKNAYKLGIWQVLRNGRSILIFFEKQAVQMLSKCKNSVCELQVKQDVQKTPWCPHVLPCISS